MLIKPNPIATNERLKKAFQFWTFNPVEAVKDWFGATPENYQADILNALLKPHENSQTRVAAKSSHGVGKTTTESWCGWHFLMTRPMSKLVATAPTANQLLDVLWPEFSKWHSRMPEEFAQLWDISATHIRCKKAEKNWFGVARTSNKQENMQGFHEDNIMVLCEEASGIPQPIFEPIEGILSNAEDQGQEALLLMVGNPTQTAGEFFDAFHKNAELYHRVTISGDPESTPDKNAGRFYISPRVSQKYRETMAKKYGKDGPVYDVRVRGVFPREADDVVVPLAWAENAQYVNIPHFDPIADGITLVMDVARFGGDETVLGVFRKKHCIGMHWWPKTSTNACVDILSEAYFHGAFGVGKIPVIRTIVDEPGVGGGVVDQAIRDGIPITPYNGNAKLIKDTDPDSDFRMFSNRRSRDWWNVRRKLELGLVSIPIDEELVNQLASVKYDYVNEKIKVETKKEMRERLGDTASPDRADVIVMGLSEYVGVDSEIDVSLVELQNSLEYSQSGYERPTASGEMDFF